MPSIRMPPSPSDDVSAAAGPGSGPVQATDDGSDEEGPVEARGDRGHVPASDQTAVFVLPGFDGPNATIREIRPDHSSRSIAFDGRPLTIGRAPDNGIVLRDGRASRHHARIDARRGSLVLSDLASTNGSYVNDRRVESIALGEGDRIRVGTTTLLVEAIDVSGSRHSGGDPADRSTDGDVSGSAIGGPPDGARAG